MTVPSWYGEDTGIDLSDRNEDLPVIGRFIEWQVWSGVWTTAEVVSHGQGIFGATSVTVRSSDGHDSLHVSGAPKNWRYATVTDTVFGPPTAKQTERLEALQAIAEHYEDLIDLATSPSFDGDLADIF